jgi:hypothetical protein
MQKETPAFRGGCEVDPSARAVAVPVSRTAAYALRANHGEALFNLEVEGYGYPRIPCARFDKSEAAALSAFRPKALARGNPDLLGTFPVVAAEASFARGWCNLATELYAESLSYLADRWSFRHRTAVPFTKTRGSAPAQRLGGDA